MKAFGRSAMCIFKRDNLQSFYKWKLIVSIGPSGMDSGFSSAVNNLKPNVVIVGHLFVHVVTRFHDAVKRKAHPTVKPNLGLEGIELRYICKGGCRQPFTGTARLINYH